MQCVIAAIRVFAILISALIMSACATHTRPITVRIPDYSAPSGSSTLSSIPALTVRVLPFKDERRDLAGEVTAAFGMPMGHVRFEQSPAALLGQVVIAEIKAAGHTVIDSAQGPQIAGSVREFIAHTDTTPLYWDVIGNVGVSLEVAPAPGANPAAPLDYHARCVDRTYIWPSETIIAGVMSKCINEFASHLRNDSRFANALRDTLYGR